MIVKWHGTASVEVISKSSRILFDPFVPLKGSDVNVRLDDFDGFEDIFITHGHFDHISSLPEIFVRNPSTRIHCTRTPYNTLLSKGIPRENLSEISFDKTETIGDISVHIIHGKHAVLPKATPSRLAHIFSSPARGNLPYIIKENRKCLENDETVFYLLEAEGKSLSLMGSLNLRDDTNYPTGSDLLILPYNGWEDNYPPAVRALEQLKPKRTVLDHYDNTFPPITTPLDLSPILNRYPDTLTAMSLDKEEYV